MSMSTEEGNSEKAIVRRTISPYDLANAVHTLGKQTPHELANRVITNQDREAISSLNDEQWQGVMNLLNANRQSRPQNHSNESWILDTGATHHMTGNTDFLENVVNMDPVMVILADGRERIAVQEGTVRLGSKLVLESVFLVPGMMSNLISVGQLLEENHCVAQLADHFLVIQDRITRTVIGVGKREQGSFFFRGVEQAAAAKASGAVPYALWHRRLGHPSEKVCHFLPDIDFSSSSDFSHKTCEVCICAKQTRDSFDLSLNKSSGLFQLIHCDVWGPYRETSHSGARYFLTIVDDYSRGVWIYLSKDKSETQKHLKYFFAMVERQFETKVKTVRSDNGT